MMWKKMVALLFGLMLVATVPSFGRVAADSTSTQGASVTVILVSDNEADGALARYLANVTGAVVVTTKWGVYDPNVTAEVMSYAPDMVIIIGGPDAVVEQYVDDLSELKITVERWGGKNRYETNVKVVGNARAKLGLTFNGSAIIVPGNDTLALEQSLKLAVKSRGVLLFVNRTSNVSRVMLNLNIKAKKITLVATPVMNKTIMHIKKGLGSKDCNCTEIEVNVTAETALKAINASEERIETAKEMLQNVTLVPQMEKLAEKMLKLADRELARAKEAYNDGKYGMAYGQAIAAKAHAEFVIRIASEQWSTRVRANQTVMARVFLWRVERQIQAMEKAGINVTELKALVDQLKTAVANGDYDAIDSIIQQIREKIFELYARGKGKFREKMVFPAHRGHGKP
ncbi:cell wall-binding repeat-containing protein [Thermococcus celer]|uniref:Cell wall-binding repeat 2 family protein n=1 Tax=Thermococcus celer Vu 13 = JCM 8558 TaxID=1293037 RepID=A0A218P3P3_THECE|nr:hypothetical protein [Thermococcus celer]ASI99548.1 hypothetical protein A3L02_08235 [Thermococcus celer Vu 13 = JCM 8558]